MLRQMNMQFVPCTDALVYPDNLGKRSKVGGAPDWLHNSVDVTCPTCRHAMEFIAQLDSFDYTGTANGSRKYMFGDVGMLYLFFCFSCHETHSIFQEY